MSLDEYRLKPPEWREPTRSDLLYKPDRLSGCPDLYETYAGQDEDQLTETNVTRGFAGRNHVQSETFSAHNMIYEKLQGEQILPELSKLVEHVQKKRDTTLGVIETNTFTLPSRTTLSEQKREAWLNDLANPDIPMSKIAKNSVPRGYKGVALLEVLATRKVPIDRAVWYIRATGLSEIRELPNSPDRTATYTSEWTNVVCQFVKKLFGEIVLPAMTSATRGVSVKGKVRATLSDPALRQNWGARFGYVLILIRKLYAERLLAGDRFLTFLVSQLRNVHFGQLPFALHLVEDYAAEILNLGTLAKEVVSSCMARLKEIDVDPLKSSLGDVRFSIRHLMEAFMVLAPSAFVQADLALRYKPEMSAVFEDPLHRPRMGRKEAALLKTALTTFSSSCQQRGRRLLCTNNVDVSSTASLSTAQLIGILDSIYFPCDIAERSRAFFATPSPTLEVRVAVALTWSTSPSHRASSQPQAVAAILRHHMITAREDYARLQSILEHWLRTQDAAHDKEAILRVYTALVNSGLFSCSRYYDSLVARGESEWQPGDLSSLSAYLMKGLPKDVSLMSSFRRRGASFQSSRGAIDTDEALQSLATLTSGRAEPSADAAAKALDRVHSLLIQGGRNKIRDAVTQAIDTDPTPSEAVWVARVTVLEALDDQKLLLKMCERMLDRAEKADQVFICADTISLLLDVFAASESVQALALALLAAHARLHHLGRWPVSASELLMELQSCGVCTVEIRRELQQNVTDPITETGVFDTNVGVDLATLKDLSSSDIMQLAAALLEQHGTADLSWVSELITSVLDTTDMDSDDARSIIRLLSDLSEKCGRNLSVHIIPPLQKSSRSARGISTNLVIELVEKNIIPLPLLLRSYLLPLVRPEAFEGLQLTTSVVFDESTVARLDAAVRLLAELHAKLASAPVYSQDLHIRARWRCVFTGSTGEAMDDLVQILIRLALYEYAMPSDVTMGQSWRQSRANIMKRPAFVSAFFRHSRNLLSTVFNIAAESDADGRTYILSQMQEWATALSSDLNFGPIDSLEQWSLMPPETVVWHLDIVRIQIQIHLERLATNTVEDLANDSALQRLMLNSDLSLAEGIAKDLTTAAVQRLLEALSTQIHDALLSNADEPTWSRLTGLAGRVLTSAAVSLKPIAQSQHTFCKFASSVRTALSPQSDVGMIRRSLFVSAMLLRCEVTPNAEVEQAICDLAGVLVDTFLRIIEDLIPPDALLEHIGDVVSGLLDSRSAITAREPALLATGIAATSGPRVALYEAYKERIPRVGPHANRIAWVLRSETSESSIQSFAVSPWELSDVSPSANLNSAPLDLSLFGASVAARGGQARRTNTSASTPSGGSQGVQIRFDSEWPTSREGLSSRDFRRGMLDDPAAPTSLPVQREVNETDGNAAARGNLKRKATDEALATGKLAKTSSAGAPKLRRK